MLRRDWTKYSKEELVTLLSNEDPDFVIEDIQSNWNRIEKLLLMVADKIAPIREYSNEVMTKSQEIPAHIRKELSQHKQILARLKFRPEAELKKKVESLFLWF